MKRKWPEIISSIPIKDSLFGYNIDRAWKHYLEENLSKEELDRIAPPICDNHEPLYYSEDHTIINYGGSNYISPSFFNCKCKHCGAEIKPNGWVLK